MSDLSLRSLSSVLLLASLQYSAADAQERVATPSLQELTVQESPATSQEAEDEDKQGWMDSSHLFVTRQSDSMVRWLDGFFGTPRSDLESAQSFLRLKLDHEWDEEEDNDLGFRVRGKVVLPRISERVGLIFSDENGDASGQNDAIDQALSDSNPKNDVALQYTSFDEERSRLDFKLGFRSSLKLKLAARYRYEQPLPKQVLGRFVEELYFRDGEGFGTFTTIEFDRPLSGEKFVRWSSRFDWGEKTRGVEWTSFVSLSRKINDRSAIAYFVNFEGDTRPNELTRGYGLGATYRRNFLRKWLFFELEPAYVWRRNMLDPPEGVIYDDPVFSDRDGVARFTARLEILFGEDQL